MDVSLLPAVCHTSHAPLDPPDLTGAIEWVPGFKGPGEDGLGG